MTVFDGSAPPVIVGHRGVRGREIAENSPAAFATAASEGAQWVELDARRSADGVAVVYHEGCTPDGVPVVQRTATQLAASGIHRLDAVLDELPDGLGVNVEVKNLPTEPDYDPDDRIAALVAEAVGRTPPTRPLLLSSFNPLTVMALARCLPGVAVGLVHYDAIAVPDAVDLALEFGAVALSSRVGADGLDAEGFAAAHAAGLQVMVWTVNDAGEARRLAAAGADALCTDDPAALRAALRPTPPG